ncbi:hypothetical protein ACL2XQ_14130 [Sodalis sp. RH14]|uniref:hypothetical protein n=1 Tax=Sodalis sp. RH14 TaxID=3394329 RepID=UPI0039B4CF74
MNPFLNKLSPPAMPDAAGLSPAGDDAARQRAPWPRAVSHAPADISLAPAGIGRQRKRDAAVAGQDAGAVVPVKIRCCEPGAALAAGSSWSASHFLAACGAFGESIEALCRDVQALLQDINAGAREDGGATQINCPRQFDRLMDVMDRYVQWLRELNNDAYPLEAIRAEVQENLTRLGPYIDKMSLLIERMGLITDAR